MLKRMTGAMALGVVLLGTSICLADCGADHKAADPGKPTGVTASDGKAVPAAPSIVVIGAPGQSVEVKAPPGYSATAVGGPGVAGRAGAAGKAAQ